MEIAEFQSTEQLNN